MIMKKIVWLAAAALLAATSAQAQVRRGCTPPVDHATRAESESYSLREPLKFDPQKLYRQPVVLISFNDRDFSMPDPKSYYHRLFNEQGFNSGKGLGCVADYFRDQSSGRINLQFDIYGPIKVDQSAVKISFSNYGESAMRAASNQLCETETADFSIYDWDGDGMVNQVIYVAAGFCGNQVKGYIWPNSDYSSDKLPGGIPSDFYSISSELWKDGTLNGIGTITHEFCHCLGLPDFYPMSPATPFSVVDEWDLMDGGNLTNKGWCPPNFTTIEKMYLGWEQPEELTSPTTVTGMKPLSEGGKSYIVRNSGNPDEYYLLENRRQTGWDYGIPGNGLLIYHVNFDLKAWRNNSMNVSDGAFRYDLFHADGKNYLDWDPKNDGNDPNKYTMPDCLRCSYLSTSPYPYANSATLVVNDDLTDASAPAATLFNAAADGRMLMGKSITNIRLADDGTISFDFMKGPETGITTTQAPEGTDAWYTLDGRRLTGRPAAKGLYIRRPATGQSRVTLVQ